MFILFKLFPSHVESGFLWFLCGFGFCESIFCLFQGFTMLTHGGFCFSRVLFLPGFRFFFIYQIHLESRLSLNNSDDGKTVLYFNRKLT